MHRWFAGIALLLLSASSASAAGWSGTVLMKMTGPHGAGGDIKVQVGDTGVLSTMTMQSPMGPMTQKSLLLSSKPGTLYVLDDASKAYTELDLAALRSQAAALGASSDGGYVVKKLGTEQIAGLSSQHVAVTGRDGRTIDLWTTKELFSGDAFLNTMGARGPFDGGLMKALAAQGADGLVVKMKQDTPDGAVTMELVKAEKASLPATLFAIPSGYRKQAAPLPGSMPAGAAMPPELQKQIEEQMKNMTPEQREMMKKAMGGR